MTLHNVKVFSPEQWPSVTVGEAMTPFDETKKVGPDQDLFNVMKLIADEDINQVPVVQGGQLLGMISRDLLLNFITLRTELGLKGSS